MSMRVISLSSLLFVLAFFIGTSSCCAVDEAGGTDVLTGMMDELGCKTPLSTSDDDDYAVVMGTASPSTPRGRSRYSSPDKDSDFLPGIRHPRRSGNARKVKSRPSPKRLRSPRGEHGGSKRKTSGWTFHQISFSPHGQHMKDAIDLPQLPTTYRSFGSQCRPNQLFESGSQCDQIVTAEMSAQTNWSMPLGGHQEAEFDKSYPAFSMMLDENEVKVASMDEGLLKRLGKNHDDFVVIASMAFTLKNIVIPVRDNLCRMPACGDFGVNATFYEHIDKITSAAAYVTKLLFSVAYSSVELEIESNTHWRLLGEVADSMSMLEFNLGNSVVSVKYVLQKFIFLMDNTPDLTDVERTIVVRAKELLKKFKGGKIDEAVEGLGRYCQNLADKLKKRLPR
ncbi:hypothetical protein HOD08_01045 [bacterium]|nr:hypothetical protein [bacterium]